MNNRYSIDRDPTAVGEACTIFRYLVGKLVNVFHRGWKVITTKPRTLGRTLECGFKIPPPGASLYGTRWWIVGINKFPVSKNAESTIRGKIGKPRICAKLRSSFLSLIVLPISNIPACHVTHPFSQSPSPFIFYSITNFPLSSSSPRLIFPSFFPSHPPHFFSPPFLISISRIPPSPLSYLTYSPFFPHLAEKMSMARQKTVLHEVTGCQTFLPRLEGSSVFRSRYVYENNTHRETCGARAQQYSLGSLDSLRYFLLCLRIGLEYLSPLRKSSTTRDAEDYQRSTGDLLGIRIKLGNRVNPPLMGHPLEDLTRDTESDEHEKRDCRSLIILYVHTFG